MQTLQNKRSHLEQTEPVNSRNPANVLSITPSETSAQLPALHSQSILSNLDPHLDKAEVIQFFKLNKTLLHEKQDPESELHDPDFPAPIYLSPRKPVWILSELMAWQRELKNRRDNLTGGVNATPNNTHGRQA